MYLTFTEFRCMIRSGGKEMLGPIIHFLRNAPNALMGIGGAAMIIGMFGFVVFAAIGGPHRTIEEAPAFVAQGAVGCILLFAAGMFLLGIGVKRPARKN